MINPRTKGSEGERAAARILQGWAEEIGIVIDPTRNLEQTRGGGFDLNGVPGLAIEVKRVEENNLSGWWKQAVRQAEKEGMTPFLMHRKNRRAWSFRVRTYAALYGASGAGTTVALDVDLIFCEAKKWFQTYLAIVKAEGV